jgi:hypothetical protein
MSRWSEPAARTDEAQDPAECQPHCGSGHMYRRHHKMARGRLSISSRSSVVLAKGIESAPGAKGEDR